MSELERDLKLLRDAVRYPATPGLAEAVDRRIEATRSQTVPAWRQPPQRVIVIGVALALLLAGGAIAAVPPARDAVLDLVGLRGATIERGTTAPAGSLPKDLDLGEPSSLATAPRLVDFHPLVPTELGEADEVFVRRPPQGGELSLVYTPRAGLPPTQVPGLGLLIGEFRGDLEPALLGKVVGPKTRVERFTLDGHDAVWIGGAPHELFYRAPDGEVRSGSGRLAANVLLVERGRRLVRLEGTLSMRAAIDIARSLR